MAINFPGSPSLNDTYTYSGKTWKWNGAAWDRSSSTETGNTEGNTGEVAYYSGKGSIIAGATAFFYDGDKVGIGTSGPTETLDVRGGITASGVLYAAGGATFGGDVNFQGNILIPDDAWIGCGASDDRITFDSSGNDITLNTNTVLILKNITHHSDTDTGIIFTDDNTKMQSGGNVFLEGTPTQVHFPLGISADAGATFGSNVNITGTGNRISFPDGLTQGSSQTDIIGIHVDNGSSVLTTGIKGHRTLPYGCEISDWRVTSTGTGDISWGINYCTYDNYPTMSAVSIGAAENPDLESQNKNKSSGSVSGRWLPYQFSAGDILQFEIDSVATITDCTLELTIRRNG